MASAWGDSWGVSWGNSWGDIGAVVVVSGRDADAGPRRTKRRPIFIVPRPEPLPAPPAGERVKRRKVTAKAVEYAVAQPWAGLWTVDEAMQVLPATVPVNFEIDGPTFDVLVQAIALQLAEEAERRMQEDEEDILLLLAA